MGCDVWLLSILVHIAAAAATLLLSQDGSREDETDADDKTYGDADCCWC